MLTILNKLKAHKDPEGAAGLIPIVKKTVKPGVLCAVVFCFAVLGSKPRASHMWVKCCH